MAIVVPPSIYAPHAVLEPRAQEKRSLRYPVRDGTGTRWLAEHEVAGRYRRRSESEVERQTREQNIIGGGLSALRRGRNLWRVCAVIPEIIGFGQLDFEALRAAESWYQSTPRRSPLGRFLYQSVNAIADHGRTVLSGGSPFKSSDFDVPQEAHTELYVNGASFCAAQVYSRSDSQNGYFLDVLQLTDLAILICDVGQNWSSFTSGGRGQAFIAVGFCDAETIDNSLSAELALVEPEQSMSRRPIRQVNRTRRMHKAPEVGFTIDLSTLSTKQGRLVVAHLAVSQLLQYFGLPESGLTTRDGHLIISEWGDDLELLSEWKEVLPTNVPNQGLPD